MSKSNMTSITLEGVKVEWAMVHFPRPTFKKDALEYSVNVGVSDAQIKTLLDAGFADEVLNPRTRKVQSRYKDSDTLGKVLKLKKLAKDSSGKYTMDPSAAVNKVKVVGRDGKTVITDSIGNGSTCNITVLLREIEGSEGECTAYLGDIQVTDLVHYEKEGGSSSFNDLDALSLNEVITKAKTIS